MIAAIPLLLLQAVASCASYVAPTSLDNAPRAAGPKCVVYPGGYGIDDSDRVLDAFEKCGNGGTIVFPAHHVYNIGKRLETRAQNAFVQLHGVFRFTPDISYWANNSFPVVLQNQLTAWHFIANDTVMEGGAYGQGGIDGNGQTWYSWSKGGSNTPGRPMSIDVYQSRNVVIKDFTIRQPQFWAVIVESSNNITLQGFLVNATNTDPAANGTNWVQNTDGCDTYRSDDIKILDWVYDGGDDCIAFKGNSTNIVVNNVTCTGGTGIAFGSVGQYPGAPDNIMNVSISSIVTLPPTYTGVGLGQSVSSGVYFKSWIGEAVGTPPNGGGGGTGITKNVTVKDVSLTGADAPVYITSCLSYELAIDPTANPFQYCNTSTYLFEDLSFKNITGQTTGRLGATTLTLNCSSAAPCKNIKFEDYAVTAPLNYKGTSVPTNSTIAIACMNEQNVTGVNCTQIHNPS
ncbi:glycoside hydrolase family 28 protein [Athelia psychrophila]|uniref:galacturonan 1,4-alpha-galacturonidase n=1 Tax=Athelia psychrophila TaxID=1759441 RepID=A0A166MB62_9AGAM|nr:glycoside hydrolase family 28 protein [Fibularhizoctonia sp. CBS 109695]